MIARLMPITAARNEALFRLEGPPAPPPAGLAASDAVLAEAEAIVAGQMRLFCDRLVDVGDPPDWRRDPLIGLSFGDDKIHWSRIAEFGQAGDIKSVWEASRFDWAIVLAQAWRLTRDPRYADSLRRWSDDWRRANPPGEGVNWKCGQETAYRLLQVLLTARILEEDERPAPGLMSFVAEHCGRIRPTIRYAIAQDNNHGTSEAAGLYVGGAWLARHVEAKSPLGRKARRWRDIGAAWLSDRADRIVAPDGSFSEHSPTYHRIVLDTFSIVEAWRRRLHETELPSVISGRAQAMTAWLEAVVDPVSGAAPLIGGNDGTNIFRFAGPRYGDFRPCLQLASLLFDGRDRFGPGPWTDAALWLSVTVPSERWAPAATAPKLMAQGGWAVLPDPADSRTRAVVRLPVYRFRPAHADALHLDFWIAGVNVLPDAGSFSYNAPEAEYDYFTGAGGHNTVEIDGRSQMPRIGRFLFSDWLKQYPPARLSFEDGAILLDAGYRDGTGACHRRTVRVSPGRVEILDRVGGIRERALLRWRLAPELEWAASGQGVYSRLLDLSVTVMGAAVLERRVVEGAISRYYLRREPVSAYEVEARGGDPLTFRTVLVTKATGREVEV